MFIVRGLWLKAGKPMPFDEFIKSDLLKELALKRKNTVSGVDTKRS
jgi:hypothetical protein